MGNQCSQNVQINMSTEPNLDVFLKSSFNMSTPSNNLLSVQAIPLLKSQGDIDAQDDEQSPSFGTRLEVAKEPKYYSRFQSNDCGGASQNEETNVPLSKKAVSFFHFNSLENQSNPVEFSSQVHSDDWNLKSVRLDSLIHKSHGKFIWEAHNTQTQKKCTVKVRLIESSKLLHTNLTKTEGILRELNVIKNPYVAEVYSFSIWETQIKNQSFFVIVIVQEPTKCSLRDIHSFKVDNEKKWTQTQILTLLHDIYSGLVACKERRITHGELILENILFSENMENAILSDFHLRLPLTGETRVSTSPIKSIFAKQGNPEASPSEAAKSLLTPDEKDIQDLLGITLQLMAVKDIPGANLEEVKTDEKYKQTYPRVLEALDEIVKKTKIPSQIIKNLEGLINNKPRGFGFDLSQTVLTTDRQDTIVDVLFTKIDCYEIINHHESAKEAYTELMSVLENKDFKGLKECEEYIKCVNKAIKYYLSTNDWLKAKEVSSELNSLLKTDQTLKNAIKAQPKQYINYIFLLGNIYEGLSEPEKAISFYIKGLTYCNKTVPDPDEYSLALRNVSNLCMKKKDYIQALDYLKKLVAFYEAQEGNYSNKADAYIRMGDVLAEQGNLGQGVKLYLKAIDNFKKENSTYDIATLEVLKKVVKLYKDLHEGDNALFYMIKSHDLKKSLFGNDSPAYLEAVKEIGDTHLEMKKYEEALTFYLKCYKLSNNNPFLTEQYTTSLYDLGNIYVKTKKYTKANEFYEKYSEIKSQGNDKASKEYFNVRDMLADIAFRENKFSKALDIQQKSYALKQQVFKADDMYLIISLTNIGDTYLANGEFEKALECHQKCLEKLEPKQTAFLQEYSQILLKIACDYNELGNGGQALALIHKSFQVSMRNGHETDMEKTIEVYETLNKLKEKKAVGLNFSKLNGGTA